MRNHDRLSAIGYRLSARRSTAYSWLLILPPLALTAFFSIYPFIVAVDASTHRILLTRPKKQPYIGLDNFREVLRVAEFRDAAVNTAVFAAMTVPAVTLLGLGVALLLNQRLPGFGLLRWIVLLPWAIPLVGAGTMWRLLLHGNTGALNGLLLELGIIDEYITWLSRPTLAMVAVTMAHLWREFPLAAILFLAGRQAIASELYDVARIDGAGAFALFRDITLPLLRPTLLIVLVYETVVSMSVFDLLYVLTGGGPGSATTVLAWYAYATTFKFYNLGQGAALSLLMAAAILVVIVLYTYILPAKEERR
ncbi:MAG TPA: sugar ABC transporter permease [Thermomicrobiales bacterium]|nr:sugar ABC transporter permease [Thermomicrobiales bacterium]